MSLIVKSLEPMKCIYHNNRGNCTLTKPRIKCKERIKSMYIENGNRYTCNNYAENE